MWAGCREDPVTLHQSETTRERAVSAYQILECEENARIADARFPFRSLLYHPPPRSSLVALFNIAPSTFLRFSSLHSLLRISYLQPPNPLCFFTSPLFIFPASITSALLYQSNLLLFSFFFIISSIFVFPLLSRVRYRLYLCRSFASFYSCCLSLPSFPILSTLLF